MNLSFTRIISTLILLLFSLSAFAQNYTLSGVVTDEIDGSPIIGVTLKIKSTNIVAVTGLDGSYAFKNLEKGSYEIHLKFKDYKEKTEKVDVAEDQILDVLLTPNGNLMDKFVFSATIDKSSETSARRTEKNAMNVVSVISEKEIDISPDITVANVIQRVSGLSLERNSNGDGQYAIVRGMDKRYNYTLVNGIKIPSPDPRNRYVPLDIFPADLLERLEVTKALTPDMEGDAIGGVVDMKMKNAPDYFTLNANVGTGYNQMFLDNQFRTFGRKETHRQSPRMEYGPSYTAKESDFSRASLDFKDKQAPVNQIYSLSVGNRFFNSRLGVLVAGSYQNTYRGAESTFMSTFVNQDDNTPYYEIVQNRKFSTNQVRSGLHTKLDYVINNNNKLNLYLAGIGLNDFENRSRVDTILLIGRGQGPGTGRIEMRERSRQRYQTIYNATLQGNHTFWKNKLKVDWSGVYSVAKSDDPDMGELMWLTAIARNSDGTMKQDPVQYGTDHARRWINNEDKDLAAYLNLHYNTQISNANVVFSAGGMFRNKDRVSSQDQYLLRTMPIFQERGNIYDATFSLFNTIGTPTDPLNYTSGEDVRAGYGMVKVNYEQWNLLTGVRYENTNFNWVSNAPATVEGKTGSIQYSDILPSVHIKYSKDKKQNFRASWFYSISRPSFLEVIPYRYKEDDYSERGNPYLKRTKANNIDLRYERFENSLDKIMLGVFYKQLRDPIETALQIQGQSVFLQPNNFGTATNWGIEFDFTKYVRNFGVRMFYTYTNSQITTTKLVRYRDEGGNLTSRNQDQTRPLQGQAAHISNISFLYKNTQHGTDAQLAMVYTGKRIMSVSPYLDNDIWQRSFIQLDFSVEQKVFKNMVVYAKINNILNTPFRADILLPNTFNPDQAPYINSTKKTMVREEFYHQTYLIGFKYRFANN